ALAFPTGLCRRRRQFLKRARPLRDIRKELVGQNEAGHSMRGKLLRELPAARSCGRRWRPPASSEARSALYRNPMRLIPDATRHNLTASIKGNNIDASRLSRSVEAEILS